MAGWQYYCKIVKELYAVLFYHSLQKGFCYALCEEYTVIIQDDVAWGRVKNLISEAQM